MATEILTFILILVTAFYAYANYRTMQIMEADVRSRTQPIPSLRSCTDSVNDYPNDRTINSYDAEIILNTSNAVLMLESMELTVVLPDDPDYEEHATLFDSHHLRPITQSDNAKFHHLYELPRDTINVRYDVVLTYYDLAKSFKFITVFSNNVPRFTHTEATLAPFSRLKDLVRMYSLLLDKMQRG